MSGRRISGNQGSSACEWPFVEREEECWRGFLSQMRKPEVVCEENSETMPPLNVGMLDEGEAGLERGWQGVSLGIALNRQQGLTRTGTRTGTGTNNLSS